MDPRWWKAATIYHIFPHSFFDSNADGIGDLNGIRQKLNYLQLLGVNVLLLCPIYRSPHVDMGYDVSDYRAIDPRYGTMADWLELVEDLHGRDMKIIMDIVSNHTSDQHPWFVDSKASRNGKRDWYIWRPPRMVHGEPHPPNNWRSIMQGSAWEFVPERGEYYLHLFAKEQPDLNWENAAVRAEMAGVMRFWMDNGCDGLRLDAINAISKPNDFPDAAVTDHVQPFQLEPRLWTNRGQAHTYLRNIRNAVFALPENQDKVTVGEAGFTFDPAEIARYVLPARNELNEVFNFQLMALDSELGTLLLHLRWGRAELRDTVAKWQMYGRPQGFWNTIFMENHDFGRSVTRFGDDSTAALRALSAKMLAVLQTTQTGTLYVYQGQEIGMKNFPRAWEINEYRDVGTQRSWNAIREKRQEETGDENPPMDDILNDLQITARDHARIPMQWNADANVGFTTFANGPWMRAYQDDANAGWNVATEAADEQSVFSFWRRALTVRGQNEVLIYGDFQQRLRENRRLIAYVRTLDNTTAWVVLNVSRNAITVPLAAVGGLGIPIGAGVVPLPRLVLSNYNLPLGPQALDPNIVLQQYEARVYVRQT